MRLNILCEGQTEEAFVNRVLRPHLATIEVYASVQCIPTKKSTHARGSKGGWISYLATRRALLAWMKSDPGAWFTTMLDLYAIPSDFPQIDTARQMRDPRQRIAFLESTFKADIETSGLRRFTPYLQLHEFEALIFADPRQLDHDYLEHDRQIEALATIARGIGDPELIDDGPDTAPSKRILREIPEYAKVKSGALIADKIGLPTLRQRCTHFGSWLSLLENLPASQGIPL